MSDEMLPHTQLSIVKTRKPLSTESIYRPYMRSKDTTVIQRYSGI